MSDEGDRPAMGAEAEKAHARRAERILRDAEHGATAVRREGIFRFSRALASLAFRPFFDLRVEGGRHLPLETSFLLLAKHQRWEDIPLLGLSVPQGLYYVAKYELFRQPLAGWFLRALGGVPLNRGRPLESRRYLRRLVQLMHHGEGVVVFPEGTYFPGSMGPGQTGILRLVLGRLRVPLVPAGLQYRKAGGRTRVTIRFAPPLLPPFPDTDRLMEAIMKEIARLSGLEPFSGAAPAAAFDKQTRRRTG